MTISLSDLTIANLCSGTNLSDDIFHTNNRLSERMYILFLYAWCTTGCGDFLNTFFIFLQIPALRTLYFSLFHCHLLYCPIILSITSQSNINRVLKLKKKAIKIISNTNSNAHANPLFYQNGILPLEQIIDYSKIYAHSSV